MIQVCSQCGTRWNVRDRRRVWCPRCHGTLLAPSGPAPGAEWSARPTAPSMGPSGLGSPPRRRTHLPVRLPAGYRWIAVRPGAAPPPRRRRRPLGPTLATQSSPGGDWSTTFEAPELQAACDAQRPLPCDGACHPHRDDGGARCRRAGARRALRAADRQPIGVVEQGGGVRSDAGWACSSASSRCS